MTLRRPILVGGVGLSMSIWLWTSLQHSIIQIGEWSILGTIAVGFILSNLPQKKITPSSWSSVITEDEVEAMMASAQTMIAILETEAPSLDISQLKASINELSPHPHREKLYLRITGAKKVGKSSLKNLLAKNILLENIQLLETSSYSHETEAETAQSLQENLAADIVLFLTDGDLTDSQWQILQQLNDSHQRLLLIFNKQDNYLPEERNIILQQLRQRVQEIISSVDVISISCQPSGVVVKQHQEDGTVEQWLEKSEVNIAVLSDRLREIVEQEKQQLILATAWREAYRLKREAKEKLNQIRRDRALPIIEQYQWIAGATAFANPVAALDLLATAAINAQMLVDLTSIYQQKISLDQAKTASSTIGKLMIKLGLVELSTQTIGSLLKSNTFTYIAGGSIQGVSAAYLTRIAGLSLIEYCQELEISIKSGENINLEKLKEKLQQIFQQNQRTAFLQNFVKSALTHLTLPSATL